MTLAEFWRSLTALKALQAEAAERTAHVRTTPTLTERTRNVVQYQAPGTSD